MFVRVTRLQDVSSSVAAFCFFLGPPVVAAQVYLGVTRIMPVVLVMPQ
jgi:hypothetical protein